MPKRGLKLLRRLIPKLECQKSKKFLRRDLGNGHDMKNPVKDRYWKELKVEIQPAKEIKGKKIIFLKGKLGAEVWKR